MSPQERTGASVLAAGALSIGRRTSAPLHAPRIASKDHSFSRHRRAAFAALLGMSLVVASTAYAAQFDLGALQPSSLFVQAGVGDQDTHAYVAGATWTWNWHRHISFLTASGYFEADIGRWTTDDHGVARSAWATQIGMTPVIRLQPSGRTDRWFAEIGVGANYIVPLYQTGHKRFSTEFNFGDHFGIGRQFGQHRQHELMLRMQHFSNAGIEHPNPGENFLQLRYSRKL
jgi:lipid A 3-O-deacylase